MKCPLFVLAKTAHYSENVMITTDCLKEECAWWDDFDKRCEFRSIRVVLTQIAETLEIICNKMPHLEQFKKA